MDTIEITLNSNELVEHIIQDILFYHQVEPKDRLGTATNKRYPYKRYSTSEVNGHRVCLWHDNWRHRYADPGVLQVHFSRFQNMEKFYIWALRVFGSAFEEIFLGRISRLDLCVDLSMDAFSIFKSVYVPRARRVRLDCNETCSLTFGAPPKEYAYYEKDVVIFDDVPEDSWCTENALDNLRAERVWIKRPTRRGTRVEARFWGKKLPVATFDELPKIANLNPFKEIKVYSMDQTLKQLSGSKLDRMKAFRAEVDRTCSFYTAARKFDVSGNFKKEIQSLLVERTDVDLQAAWTNRTKRFFPSLEDDTSFPHEVAPAPAD